MSNINNIEVVDATIVEPINLKIMDSEIQAKVTELGKAIAQLLAEIGITSFQMNTKEMKVDIEFDEYEANTHQIEDVTEDINLITEQL